MKELARIILLKPLFNLLILIAALVPGNSIGWGIILLTLLVRLILFLPTKKALVAQRKLQLLAPHLEEVKQKHKGDQKAQAQATLELYREHGVSPAGACLPALIQLPILIILYYVFTIGLSTNRFDLLYQFTPRPEHFNIMFFGLNLTQTGTYILPLLAGALQFIASRQLTPISTPNQPKNVTGDMMQSFNKQMLYLFPIMTFFIGRSLPAALSLYWVTTTLFSVIQQQFLFKNIKVEQKLKKTIAEEIKEEKSHTKGIEVTIRKRKPI